MVIDDVVFVLLSNLTIESEGLKVQWDVAEDRVATLSILEVLSIYKVRQLRNGLITSLFIEFLLEVLLGLPYDLVFGEG